jgi:hypothetical protein
MIAEKTIGARRKKPTEKEYVSGTSGRRKVVSMEIKL